MQVMAAEATFGSKLDEYVAQRVFGKELPEQLSCGLQAGTDAPPLSRHEDGAGVGEGVGAGAGWGFTTMFPSFPGLPAGFDGCG
jgi:hypothetical protein